MNKRVGELLPAPSNEEVAAATGASVLPEIVEAPLSEVTLVKPT